jgi:serine/threonine protein kinase
MPLVSGTLLGPYEIRALIGAGGMGEVYRARDTKLKRDVALKVLPEAFAKDPGRMLRFQREAEVLASLNHPNIAPIYGVEERALIMELVEGESPKGPMPFDDAWKIALQIAGALEYAHERGVIHRDLKPANVKVTPEGVVKVLDFGLAKAFSETPDAACLDPENSPTVTLGATVAGTVMGTAAYMPPEQAKGKRVDKRADIWSWGVVLYELLTGERLFQGDEAADTLAQVLTKQPPLERAPPQVRKLLRRCLEKDPRRRLRDIGDARDLLDETAAPRIPSRARLGWITAGLLAVTALTFGILYFRKPTEVPRVIRFSILPPEKGTFAPDIPAISPDGRRMALVVTSGGQNSIWIRDLDSFAFRPLPGTEDARYPFWAPDSRQLAFFAGSKLKTIDLSVPSAPLPAVTICDCPSNVIGGSWGKGNVILFTPGFGSEPLSSIPAVGGTPTPVTKLQAGERFHAGPWFLPDGRHFLYQGIGVSAGTTLYLGELGSKAQQTIRTGVSPGVYASPGYVLFTTLEHFLMAQPVDGSKGEATGDPLAVFAEPIGSRGVGNIPLFSASQNGVLVYASGAAGAGNVQLTWFDRSGIPNGTVGMPDRLQYPAISPDGTTVAYAHVSVPQGGDIWLHDLARGSNTRFTPRSLRLIPSPVWSGDGSHIAFFDRPSPEGSIVYQRATRGQAQDEVLDKGDRIKRSVDWSSDSRYIIEESLDTEKTGYKIWVQPLFGDRKPSPYLNSQFNETDAKLSPDGHWLAFVSDKSKGNQVYVTSFPKPGNDWPISVNGGDRPIWSRNGKELYFISADQKMMVVDLKPGSKFDYGAPKALFDVHIDPQDTFDVARDGRFLIPVPAEQGATTTIHVVINWQAGLNK